MIETTIIPILNDNYTYLIKDKKTDIYALVDPADAKPLISILEKKKKTFRLHFKYSPSS